MADDDRVTLNVSEKDVLCGRGTHSNRHPGNRLFRRLVDANKDLYSSFSAAHKTLLAISVVQTIHHLGGKFLQKRKEDFVEVSTKHACTKTAQALRELGPSRKLNGQTTQSPLNKIFEKPAEKEYTLCTSLTADVVKRNLSKHSVNSPPMLPLDSFLLEIDSDGHLYDTLLQGF